jgi:hypothetical protein
VAAQIQDIVFSVPPRGGLDWDLYLISPFTVWILELESNDPVSPPSYANHVDGVHIIHYYSVDSFIGVGWSSINMYHPPHHVKLPAAVFLRIYGQDLSRLAVLWPNSRYPRGSMLFDESVRSV